MDCVAHVRRKSIKWRGWLQFEKPFPAPPLACYLVYCAVLVAAVIVWVLVSLWSWWADDSDYVSASLCNAILPPYILIHRATTWTCSTLTRTSFSVSQHASWSISWGSLTGKVQPTCKHLDYRTCFFLRNILFCAESLTGADQCYTTSTCLVTTYVLPPCMMKCLCLTFTYSKES